MIVKPNVEIKKSILFKFNKTYCVYRFGKCVGSYSYHPTEENVILVKFGG